MGFDKKKLKQAAGLIVFTIAVYTVFINYEKVFSAFAFVWDLIFPFVLGGAIAFILNLPMRGIEKQLAKLSGQIKNSKVRGAYDKMLRGISLVFSIMIFIAVLSVVICVVAPQLVKTAESIGVNFMENLPRFQEWIKRVFADNPQIEKYLEEVTVNWQDIFDSAKNFIFNGAGNLLSHTFLATVGIISGITNFFIAFVFACYILFQKEKLASQVRRVLKVIFNEKIVAKIEETAAVSHRIFGSFITGQCLEACILGLMFFVSMLIFRLPYALLISILIAFTALIPIVGAFIGCVVGAFLILMINPLQAVFFVIMFFVIQQIEGNLIYPHVVGNSVGLPSIWVLVAVTIGGSLMGIVGMLLFIPLVSIVYALFKDWVRKREAQAGTM